MYSAVAVEAAGHHMFCDEAEKDSEGMMGPFEAPTGLWTPHCIPVWLLRDSEADGISVEVRVAGKFYGNG